MANEEQRRKLKLQRTFRATPGDCTTVTLKYKGEDLATIKSKVKPGREGR